MVAEDVAKRERRRSLRAARRTLVDTSTTEELTARSAAIVDRLVGLEAVTSARRLVAYRALPGEVDTTTLLAWCTRHDVEVVAPDPEPTAVPPHPASWADAIVVPGLAFTADGRRLGQGGGWYDHFLADRSANTSVIGLVYGEFLLDDLPIEPHDVRVDCVVTDDAAWWSA